ncbi:ssDNA-binding protein [Aminobacter sp. BE322]|uniref:ssDNA-binding protein n=1 Tax=unclassified Aminobacter TaxID=2644704 RepID=UPI003D1D1C27
MCSGNREWRADHTFIRCTSGEDYKPKVFDRKRNPVLDKADCPSGSRGFAVVNAFTWENEENGKGISFGISMFQVTKKAEGGEILGGTGGPDPDKFFETIDDEGDAPASTKTGNGAASLFG